MVSVGASFNDLGTLDTHTATISWGSGGLDEQPEFLGEIKND